MLDANHGILEDGAQLARMVADDLNADDQHRQELATAAALVGDWLARRGVRDRWDLIDVSAVIECLPAPDVAARDRFLLTLIGLLGSARSAGRLPPEVVRAYMAEIEIVSTSFVVRRLARIASAPFAGGGALAALTGG